jgi:hypothetical protein
MDLIIYRRAEFWLVLIAVCFLFGPIVHYLRSGWVSRWREIVGGLSDDAIMSYFRAFFFAHFGNSTHPKEDFAKLHHERYGRQHFIVPAICLFFVAGSLLALVGWTVSSWLGRESSGQSGLPPVAVAAIAGAYMWVSLDLISRAQQRDLVPASLFGASFRLAVAAPLGLAIATLLRPEVGVAIAVLLGAFPTRTLLTIARRTVVRRLGGNGLLTEERYELESLKGIGRRQAERFEDERVLTILQLAYSDPIDLTIRTNFSFSYVVDCCSQALAWLYFQQDLAKMRRFGLRGGQEINTLISEIDGEGEEDTQKREKLKKQAEECRDVIAAELKMKPQVLERSMREIAEDPYTTFLSEVWFAL